MTEARPKDIRSGLALRTGLPFGAVMATGVSSQVARALGVRVAVAPLLWVAIAECVFITARGAVRHRAEFRARPTIWTRLGPPGEHTGILTVTIGLAVTTVGLAAETGWLAASLALLCLELTWTTGALFGARLMGALLKARPRLHDVGGDWFLAPAALLAAAIASVASVGHVGTAAGRMLAWAGLAAAAAGALSYWALTVVALIRVSKFQLDGSRRILWWIWAGCGGLAAVALAAVADVGGHTHAHPTPGTAEFDPTLEAALRFASATTWAAGTVVLVPVLFISARHAISRRRIAPRFPWPPTFSTAVIAIGALDVGRLMPLAALEVVGKAVGYATLVGWLITATRNATSLIRRPPPSAADGR